MPKKKTKKPSPRELKICLARIKNPTWYKYRCYMVGYPKIKIESAYSASTVFFDKPHIVEYIDSFHKRMIEKVEVTEQYVLRGLMKIVEFDPSCMLDKDGFAKALHELDPEDRKVIEAVSEFQLVKVRDKDGNERVVPYIAKFKTGSKVPAFELLGKYLKMFTDKTEIDFPEIENRKFNLNFNNYNASDDKE